MPLDALPAWLGFSGGGELAAHALLPYRDHISERVVELRDGSLMAADRLPGSPFVLLSNAGRNRLKRRHVAFLNAAADDNVEICEHLVRHDGVPGLPPRPDHVAPYAAKLLGDYHATLDGRLRVNDWFLTVRVKPRVGPLAWLLPGRRGGDAGSRAALERQLGEIMRLAAVILREMAPVPLGLRTGDDPDAVFSEVMEALYLIRTTRHLAQPLVDPAGELGAALYSDDVICGRRGFEIRHAPFGTPGASTFGTNAGLITYPRRPKVDAFDDLLSLDGRFVMTNFLGFHTRAQSQEAMERLQGQLENAGDRAVSDTAQLDDAIDAVASGREERGTSRWSLALHGDTMADVDRLVSATKNILANAQAKVTTEGQGQHAAYWAQFPGCSPLLRIRPASISTEAFAHLSSLAGFARGPAKPRWGGHLLRLATTAWTPFDHDQFVGDVGHMTVIGSNGVGKTVWLGMNIACLDGLVRAAGGTQIVLDVDESNASTILALGGSYTELASGEDSGCAPLLALPDKPRVRAMLREFIGGLVQDEGAPPPNAAEGQGIADGVAFVMGELAPEQRSFAAIRPYLGYAEGGAGERFERWCRGGEFGWTFDGERHTIDMAGGLCGIGLTHIMNTPRIMGPMGTMLLWMASDLMDGRRVVVWAEEAPAYLPRPEFSGMFKGVALRARKRNAAFVAIAQMPGDLLSNDAGRAVVKQSRQMVLFPNDGAEHDDYVHGLGCTEAEFRMVREGMLAVPHSLLIRRKDGQSGVCRFDLSALPEHLAVLSGTTNSVRLLRDVIARMPDAPMDAVLREFWRRLPEAAA